MCTMRVSFFHQTPDYFDIITNPMDFGTIREKLDLAQYVSLKAFLSDVRLVFFNCDAYNQVRSLSRIFHSPIIVFF